MISAAEVPKLFKESLSSDILASYVEVVSNSFLPRCGKLSVRVLQFNHPNMRVVLWFRAEITRCLDLLEALSKTARFDLVKMFLSEAQAAGTPLQLEAMITKVSYVCLLGVKSLFASLNALARQDESDAVRNRVAAVEKAWLK